jgi:hypothetical protein
VKGASALPVCLISVCLLILIQYHSRRTRARFTGVWHASTSSGLESRGSLRLRSLYSWVSIRCPVEILIWKDWEGLASYLALPLLPVYVTSVRLQVESLYIGNQHSDRAHGPGRLM